MNTTTDHRLSDSDLTVLVERAAQGSWDSQLGPASGTMWDEVPHATKNSYREQVLSIIFHGTKALHELGYRKPRTITLIEELSALPDGTVVLDPDGDVARKVLGGWTTTVVEDDGSMWLTDNQEDVDLPATVLHEPGAAA